MFDRVLIVVDAHTGGRDALTLGRDVASPVGSIIVAILDEDATGRSLDAEVYSAVRGDPRVTHLRVAGVPVRDAIPAIAAHLEAQVVVISQHVVDPQLAKQLADHDRRWTLMVPCFGHRFQRTVEAVA